jgi:hypothetical protein
MVRPVRETLFRSSHRASHTSAVVPDNRSLHLYVSAPDYAAQCSPARLTR